MASYKSRLTADLDDWIAAGLVPETSREPILDRVAEPRRLDAATALAFVGVALLGAAIVAFAAANWGAIPRVVRFGGLLLAFLAASGGGAWAAGRNRPAARNALITVAAFVFAAAVGLTGQIFDVAGDPRRALYAAGVGAGLLGLAGRSSGALIAAVALIGSGDFVGEDGRMIWLALAAPAAAAAAWLWCSAPLAHAAGVGIVVAALHLAFFGDDHIGVRSLVASGVLAAAALGARALPGDENKPNSVLYGWCAWGALILFAMASWEASTAVKLGHRLAWLALGAGAVALGRNDRHGLVTAGGVLALIGAATAVLFDLGLGLRASSAIFAVCALGALAAGWIMRGAKA